MRRCGMVLRSRGIALAQAADAGGTGVCCKAPADVQSTKVAAWVSANSGSVFILYPPTGTCSLFQGSRQCASLAHDIQEAPSSSTKLTSAQAHATAEAGCNSRSSVALAPAEMIRQADEVGMAASLLRSMALLPQASPHGLCKHAHVTAQAVSLLACSAGRGATPSEQSQQLSSQRARAVLAAAVQATVVSARAALPSSAADLLAGFGRLQRHGLIPPALLQQLQPCLDVLAGRLASPPCAPLHVSVQGFLGLSHLGALPGGQGCQAVLAAVADTLQQVDQQLQMGDDAHGRKLTAGHLRSLEHLTACLLRALTSGGLTGRGPGAAAGEHKVARHGAALVSSLAQLAGRLVGLPPRPQQHKFLQPVLQGLAALGVDAPLTYKVAAQRLAGLAWRLPPARLLELEAGLARAARLLQRRVAEQAGDDTYAAALAAVTATAKEVTAARRSGIAAAGLVDVSDACSGTHWQGGVVGALVAEAAPLLGAGPTAPAPASASAAAAVEDALRAGAVDPPHIARLVRAVSTSKQLRQPFAKLLAALEQHIAQHVTDYGPQDAVAVAAAVVTSRVCSDGLRCTVMAALPRHIAYLAPAQLVATARLLQAARAPNRAAVYDAVAAQLVGAQTPGPTTILPSGAQPINTTEVGRDGSQDGLPMLAPGVDGARRTAAATGPVNLIVSSMPPTISLSQLHALLEGAPGCAGRCVVLHMPYRRGRNLVSRSGRVLYAGKKGYAFVRCLDQHTAAALASHLQDRLVTAGGLTGQLRVALAKDQGLAGRAVVAVPSDAPPRTPPSRPSHATLLQLVRVAQAFAADGFLHHGYFHFVKARVLKQICQPGVADQYGHLALRALAALATYGYRAACEPPGSRGPYPMRSRHMWVVAAPAGQEGPEAHTRRRPTPKAPQDSGDCTAEPPLLDLPCVAALCSAAGPWVASQPMQDAVDALLPLLASTLKHLAQLVDAGALDAGGMRAAVAPVTEATASMLQRGLIKRVGLSPRITDTVWALAKLRAARPAMYDQVCEALAAQAGGTEGGVAQRVAAAAVRRPPSEPVPLARASGSQRGSDPDGCRDHSAPSPRGVSAGDAPPLPPAAAALPRASLAPAQLSDLTWALGRDAAMLTWRVPETAKILAAQAARLVGRLSGPQAAAMVWGLTSLQHTDDALHARLLDRLSRCYDLSPADLRRVKDALYVRGAASSESMSSTPTIRPDDPPQAARPNLEDGAPGPSWSSLLAMVGMEGGQPDTAATMQACVIRHS